MCLGVPGRIVSIDPRGGQVARVDFWGMEREVRLDVVDQPVAPGDYVLIHVGFAIRRIPPSEIAHTLALYDELIAAGTRSGQPEDPMQADLLSELSGTRGRAPGDPVR